MEPKTSTRVTLEVTEHKMSQSFEITHAERLLKMKNNGGWKLPEDSKYTFDLKNGIRIKSTKKEPESTNQ